MSVDPLGPQPNFVIDARVVIGQTGAPPYSARIRSRLSPAEMELRNGRFDALARLVGWSQTRTIVAGDFNTSSWSPCFPKLMAATGLYDTRAGLAFAPPIPAGSGPRAAPIDHCLVSGDIAVVDRRVGADIGSDHLPIVVDLQLPRRSLKKGRFCRAGAHVGTVTFAEGHSGRGSGADCAALDRGASSAWALLWTARAVFATLPPPWGHPSQFRFSRAFGGFDLGAS